MSVMSRTAPVVIYQGDDLEQIAFLRRKVERSKVQAEEQKAAGTARAGGNDVAALEAEHDAFIAEAEERAVVVRLRALGRKQWRGLLADHPPRYVKREVDGGQSDMMHSDDVGFGVNTDTFGEALLAYVNPTRPEMRTIVEPTMTGEERQDFLDDLSGGDFERLWATAFQLNGAAGGDPADFTYSTRILTSE